MSSRVIAGRTVLITGGARGIGRATAEALHREGLTVAIADIDAETVSTTAEALSTDGRPVHPYVLDVRDPKAFVDVVARIKADLGPLDVLINNAGIMPIGPFLELDPLLDDRQIDINYRGVIHGMRAVLPGMLQRGRGHVVNITSTAGVVGVPYVSVYSGTKHAVRGLTEAVRGEILGQGVDLSYVMPSIVDTELTSGTKALRYPPRVAPSEVADAIVGCLRTGRVDVFVPKFAGLASVLPVLLPRRITEALGRLFGVADVFQHVDSSKRGAYRARITS